MAFQLKRFCASKFPSNFDLIFHTLDRRPLNLQTTKSARGLRFADAGLVQETIRNPFGSFQKTGPPIWRFIVHCGPLFMDIHIAIVNQNMLQAGPWAPTDLAQ